MHGLKLSYLHCFHCCLASVKHLLCTKDGQNISLQKRHLNIFILSIERYIYVICGTCGHFKYLIIQCPDLKETLDFKCFIYFKIMSVTPEILETWRNVYNLPPELCTAIPESLNPPSPSRQSSYALKHEI